jgi:hypothetical protein
MSRMPVCCKEKENKRDAHDASDVNMNVMIGDLEKEHKNHPFSKKGPNSTPPR